MGIKSNRKVESYYNYFANSGTDATGPNAPNELEASGGNVTPAGITPGNGYRYHVFTSPGTFQVTKGNNIPIEVFLVGGGGPGGECDAASWVGATAGGGGGGVMYCTSYPISIGSHTVTVGTPGDNPATTDGADTTFLNANGPQTLTGKGGGTGNWYNSGNGTTGVGWPGGSGGGNAYGPDQSSAGQGIQPTQNPGIANIEQFGHNGGLKREPGGANGPYAYGGGGGSGGAGHNGVQTPPGGGGQGGSGGWARCFVEFASTTMAPVLPADAEDGIRQGFYASGGGGGGYTGGPEPLPNSGAPTIMGYQANTYGGGKAAGPTPRASAGKGVENTGGGGGGSGNSKPQQPVGGRGGKGICIIRYWDGTEGGIVTPSGATATGGTKTTYGSKTIHVFKASGAFQSDVDISKAEFIIVGGGGGGGNGCSSPGSGGNGGGGAGGIAVGDSMPFTGGVSYTVTVGDGGPAPLSQSNGTTASARMGSDSSIAGPDITTISGKGGGGGGNDASPTDPNVQTGGCGGGGGGSNAAPTPSRAATQPSEPNTYGAINLGMDGGKDNPGPGYAGGGGGGAGAWASDVTNTMSARGDGTWPVQKASNGGVGWQVPISLRDPTNPFGTPGPNPGGFYLAGGGGGAMAGPMYGPPTQSGYGGAGGGGGGTGADTNGTANTGGGGGGGNNQPGNGDASGGSGIVIIAYPT